MPGGRPTDYRAEYAEQAEKLCLLGATDIQLADFFDVAESTIHLWKHTHPEFSESIKDGKENVKVPKITDISGEGMLLK